MPRSGYLLLAVTVLLFVYPWTIGRYYVQVGFEILSTSMAMFGLYVMAASPRLRSLGVGLGVTLVLANVVAACTLSPYFLIFSLILALVFYGVLIVALLDALRRQSEVTGDTMCMGVCVYLLWGVWFGTVYTVLALTVPGSFEGRLTVGHFDNIEVADLMYFSFSSLTTAGYGDIIPVTAPARFAAVFEQVIGVVYTTVVIARLVALYSVQGVTKK